MSTRGLSSSQSTGGSTGESAGWFSLLAILDDDESRTTRAATRKWWISWHVDSTCQAYWITRGATTTSLLPISFGILHLQGRNAPPEIVSHLRGPARKTQVHLSRSSTHSTTDQVEAIHHGFRRSSDPSRTTEATTKAVADSLVCRLYTPSLLVYQRCNHCLLCSLFRSEFRSRNRRPTGNGDTDGIDIYSGV